MCVTGGQSRDSIDSSEVPKFIGRGERADLGSWNYYECPGCGEPTCSFCDCPNEDCRWYDSEGWRETIRETVREHDDPYTGSLEVPADA